MNDSLDDLFGGPMVTPSVLRVKSAPPASYAPKSFIERCAKCGGNGRFISYAGRDCGPCFACKGAGKQTFKASAQDRAQAREASAERKARKLAEGFEAFCAEFPAESSWLIETANRWPVAASILEGARKYGGLTEKQLAMVRNGILRDEARAASKAERAASAPSVAADGVDRLKAAFDAAAAYAAARGRGIRRQRITLGDAVISPAPATGKNPGALYVKSGETYLGKIAAGRFHASADCDATTQTRVLAFIANPKAAAEQYGQETGVCCVCNATLTNQESIARGIGPICAEKFGW